MGRGEVDVDDDGGAARERFSSERRARLVAPEDDMWAQLAEDATPQAIVIDGVTAGFCAVDDDRRLRAYYVTARFDLTASETFTRTVESVHATTACASTVDPVFLALSLTAGSAADEVGLMYEHVDEPRSASVEMRIARSADHAAVVAFDHEQTDSPFDFLEPYLAERIARDELALLIDDDGRIVATGECRADPRSARYAHLGLIVRTGDRNGGVGRRVLSAMVAIAKARGLQPLCSTEPTNVAARHVIHDAGFRHRHSVFSVAMPQHSPR